ncbi:MAG: radical SAM protein [Bacteroidales bacterium 43_36]|jgi:radical SAM protein with 4Fe4S-binding SPASM domain|nr:MAG: radical SAM protein [Bacteroidales bacterium 43_36]
MYSVFNPKYSLRSDENRIIIFDSINNDGWMSYIHPIHAILLATLGRTNSITTTETYLLEAFGIPTNITSSFINSLLDNKESTHVNFGDLNIAFPPETLITSPEINKRNFEGIIQVSRNMHNVDLKTKRLNSGPDKIVFMLNNKCAVKCAYCYADTYTKCNELSFNEFCNIIDECKNIGVRKIEIIGGDIFVKPNWEEYIGYVLSSGYPIDFLSTKKPLSHSDICKLIITGFTGDLQISLDTINPSIHNSLIQTNHDYLSNIKHTLDVLASFDSLPFRIKISTVLCSINASHDSLFELFSFLNIYSIIFQWDICYALPSFKKCELELCTSEQEQLVKQYINDLISNYNPKFDIVVNSKGISPKGAELLCESHKANFRCSANISSCFILPDGKVTLCERLYWNSKFIIGDLKQDTLVNIWKSPKAIFLYELEKYIDKKSPCFSCAGRKECYGKNKRCLVNVALKYGDNITFPDPSCIKSI